MKSITVLIFLTIICLSACSVFQYEEPVGMVSTEVLPTVIALTLKARGIGLGDQTATEAYYSTIVAGEPPQSTADFQTSPSVLVSSTSTITSTLKTDITATPRPSFTPRQATDTPDISALITHSASIATHTPEPRIPEASIQIYWIGELSKVVTPLNVIARLTSRVGKVVRVELYGEDGRLLARQLKTYYNLPWHVAGINTEINFEVRGAAEMGRLVISAEDVHQRLIDLNSINLILLSSGESELNPTSALYQRIVIQEPKPDALIQGGTLVVSGLAKPETGEILRMSLVAEDGRTLGQRLVGVESISPGGYGTFIVEVPYTVDELTPTRLIVSEDGGIVSPIAHLSSVEIMLSP